MNFGLMFLGYIGDCVLWGIIETSMKGGEFDIQ